MKTFREVLTDGELDTLQNMIGLELHTILSPSVSTKMGSSTYTLDWSASFSFNQLQKKSFVVFTCHHKETDLGDDYWKLEVYESTHPKNIGHEQVDNLGYGLTGNLAAIHVSSTIKKITIYSVHITDKEEQLEYDAVLVFQFENGQRIGMARQMFLIEISCDSNQINNMIEHCYEKYCLE